MVTYENFKSKQIYYCGYKYMNSFVLTGIKFQSKGTPTVKFEKKHFLSLILFLTMRAGF